MTTTLITGARPSSRRRGTRLSLLAGATTLALMLAACGDSTDTDPEATTAPSSSPAATETDEPEEVPAEETDAPLPRLVIAHDGGVSVVDAESLTVLDTFEIDGIAQPTVASDDRHVYIASRAGGDVIVLDSGSYASAHGDHAHYYVREPAMRDITVPGERPSHIVAGDSVTAVFDDATGTTSYFRDAGLLAGGLDVQTVEGTPHHGVAVALADDEFLISSLSGGESPDSVVRVDESGDALDTSPECRSLHGVAETDDAVAFGCEGSVLVYEDGEFRSIALDSDDDRISTLSGTDESDVLLGNFSDTEISLVDVDHDTVQVVDLGVTYTSLTRGAHGEAIVLGSDGELRIIDPESGEITDVVPAIDAFEIDSDWSQPRPAVIVLSHTAYVTDVAESRVIAIDLDNGEVIGEVSLESAPYALVATNTAYLHGGGHGHSHDEDDDHDDHDDHDDDHDHDEDHDH